MVEEKPSVRDYSCRLFRLAWLIALLVSGFFASVPPYSAGAVTPAQAERLSRLVEAGRQEGAIDFAGPSSIPNGLRRRGSNWEKSTPESWDWESKTIPALLAMLC